MATMLKTRPLPQCSCRQTLRRKTSWVVPKATSVRSAQQTLERVSTVDGAVRQRTGSSYYVNFNATSADFASVLARLEASSSLPPERRAAKPETAPAQQRKSWTAGFMDGLFGSKQQHHAGPSETELIQDDGSPLSHAVVMFTATWCGPCSVVYRELKLAAGRLQGRPPTAILVIDVEQEKELASDLGIKALPTLLYMSPDNSRGPIFTQGPVSASFILDAMDRAVGFGGHDVKAKWLKL